MELSLNGRQEVPVASHEFDLHMFYVRCGWSQSCYNLQQASDTMDMSKTCRYTRIGFQIKATVSVIQVIQPVACGQHVARGDV